MLLRVFLSFSLLNKYQAYFAMLNLVRVSYYLAANRIANTV